MNKLVTEEEMCEMICTSRWSLYALRKKGLPFVRVGNKVRYDLDEVGTWLKQNTAGNVGEQGGQDV